MPHSAGLNVRWFVGPQAAVAVLLLWLFLLPACTSDDEITTNNHNEAAELPDQEGWDAVLTATQNGKKTSRIQYSHMAYFAGKKLIRFDDGVTIDYYDDNGVLVSTVVADQALLSEDTHDIEFDGKVRVNAQDGVELHTEKLTWHDAERKIQSDAFVTVITAEGDTINGTGFESGKSLQSWSIKKPWGVTQKKLNLQESD
jgi:LPS export ABC transporter protein LptC